MPDDPNPAPEPGINPNPGATFDADAFMTRLVGEMDKRTNAMAKQYRELAQKLDTKAAPKPADDPKPADGDPNPPSELKDARTIADLNAEMKRLAKQLDERDKRAAAAEEKAAASEKARLESERLSAIDGVLSSIDFASPKARTQFRDAYAGKVERDEDGALIVRTEKGEPLPFNTYLTSEAEASPHFLAPAGKGGAGATAGKKGFGGSKVDVLSMSPAEISKLPADQRAAAWQDAISAVR